MAERIETTVACGGRRVTVDRIVCEPGEMTLAQVRARFGGGWYEVPLERSPIALFERVHLDRADLGIGVPAVSDGSAGVA